MAEILAVQSLVTVERREALKWNFRNEQELCSAGHISRYIVLNTVIINLNFKSVSLLTHSKSKFNVTYATSQMCSRLNRLQIRFTGNKTVG